MRPLRIMTMVWGDQYIDWFERALVKSFSWPKNKKALENATWNIFTKAESAEKVLEIARSVGVKKIEYAEMSRDIVGNSPNMGYHMLNVLHSMIDICLADGSQMITAPPDTIFSDGTISTLLQMSKYGDTCVAVPHPRVNPSILDSIGDSVLTGPALVSKALEFAHKSWTVSELGAVPNGTHVSGVLWQKLDDKLWAVQHRIPTVYIASFKPEDKKVFQVPHNGLPAVYGYWDWVWPALLMKDERQRTVGASDAACIVEVTKENLNVPPIGEPNLLEPDSFYQHDFHHNINRQLLYIMRAE